MEISLKAAARRFGEINVPLDWLNDATKQCRFEPNFGVYKTSDKLNQFFEKNK
jgi:hypothetical protein